MSPPGDASAAVDRPGRRPLAGRSVVTTREEIGRLDRLLARLGADVLHVPLIATADPDDGGAELRDALGDLDGFDWLVVTSANGAERVADAVTGSGVRLAVVGTRTGDVLTARSGRAPDVVPERQTAADLAAAMPEPGAHRRLLIAQADLADPAHADAFAARGYLVTTVTAYRTVARRPSVAERRAALGADVVAFASGSAASAWVDAFGTDAPPVVAVIGPSTAAAAAAVGLNVTHQAADHSVQGLADEIVRAVTGDS